MTPILQAGYLTLLESEYAYLMTLGTIMQQGMLVHETAVSYLQKKLPSGQGPTPGLQGA